MKKIMILLAVVGTTLLASCTGPEGPPGLDGENGTGAAAFDISNQNLFKENNNLYSVSNTFVDEVNNDLQGSDMILVYIKTKSTDAGLPVWQLIPRTIYFPNGDVLNYDFDFTVKDYIITASGNYVLSNRPDFILNQTFRVVIVPNDLLSAVNKNNYLEVMKVLNLDDSKIQQVQF